MTDVVRDYMEGAFTKKLILGQMRDPRSIIEEDVANPLEKVKPLKRILFWRKSPSTPTSSK